MATSLRSRNTMHETITVTISAEIGRVRMLASTPTRDLMKAVLGPAAQAHPRAAATILEGLALWHQQPVSVVLCVDDEDECSALGLCDALGFGRTLHYEVGLAYKERRRGQRRVSPLRGLGDFRDLRPFGLWGSR
jgi:hypothetical protein